MAPRIANLPGEGNGPPVTSVSLMLAYVSGGVGVGLAPRLALDDLARDRAVVEPADVPATPARPVSRPAIRWVREYQVLYEVVTGSFDGRCSGG